MKRKSTKVNLYFTLFLFCCASSTNWVSTGIKEPELTPTLFGHSNQLLFQITISLSSVPKEPLTSSVQSAKHSARRVGTGGTTIEAAEVERAGASTIVIAPTTDEPRAGTVRKASVI